MAKTVSLKNTVRSTSVPLSVQCSSDPLIRVSFSLANPIHVRSAPYRSADYLYLTRLPRRDLLGHLYIGW
jgi:hypothetical protein